MDDKPLIGSDALQNYLVPVRQSDGSLKIVSVSDFVWSELKTVLDDTQPRAVMSFLPPERHMELVILSITMSLGIPLVCGSVYDLPWTVRAFQYSDATSVISETSVLPYLLKALEGNHEATTPLQIIVVSDRSDGGDNSNPGLEELFSSLKPRVKHLSNPFSQYVS